MLCWRSSYGRRATIAVDIEFELSYVLSLFNLVIDRSVTLEQYRSVLIQGYDTHLRMNILSVEGPFKFTLMRTSRETQ